MRSPIVILLVFLASTTGASEPVRPEQAADEVRRAVEASDTQALAALAARERPDAWLVVDVLCQNSDFDAAAAFSAAKKGKAFERLSPYVEAQRGRKVDPAIHRAIRAMNKALIARDYQGVLDAASSVTGPADSIALVRVAFGRAHAHHSMQNHKEAAANFLSTAEAAEALGWYARATNALHHAGESAYHDADFPSALSAWRARLRLERLLESKTGISRALNNIGIVEMQVGKYDAALARFEESLRIARSLGDVAGAATALSNVGDVQMRRGEHDAAFVRYKESLRMLRELGDQSELAHALRSAANALAGTSRYSEALAHLEEALAVARKTRDARGVARTLLAMGITRGSLGEFRRAQEHMEDALRVSRQLGDRAGTASALARIGSLRTRLGDPRGAITHLTEALRIDREIGDVMGMGRTLEQLGVANEQIGDYETARTRYEEALALHLRLGDVAGLASSYSNLGTLHAKLGEYPQALKRYEAALVAARRASSVSGIATARSNLGAAYEALGNYVDAKAHYKAAIEAFHRVGNAPGEATALLGLALVQDRSGSPEHALTTYKDALQRYRAIGDEVGVAYARHNIAGLHEEAGAYDLAIEAYARSLATFREAEDRVGTANTLQNMGRIETLRGRHASARETLERAREALGDTPSLETMAQLAEGFAALSLEEGEHAQSIRWARQGATHVGQLGRGLAEGEAAGMRDPFQHIFAIGTLAAHRGGAIEDLLWFLEQGRAASLREGLGSPLALERAVLPLPLTRALAQARHAERQAAAAFRTSQTHTRGAARKVRRAWIEAREKVAEVERRIQREAKAAASIVLGAPDGLKRVQGRLGPAEALVSYGFTHAESVALVVRRDGARLVTLPSAGRIETGAEAMLQGDLAIDPKQVAAVRALVVDPLALPATVTRVFVSPVGRLGFVPFALLMPDKEVVYVPSATTHGLLLQRQPSRGSGVLALGDPDYRMSADREALRVRSGNDQYLTPLPATRKEVERIADVPLLGEAATETGLQGAIDARPRWRAVHFACHGLINGARPMLSSLALTADEKNDGLLTALDVFRMRIPADLVVLSACETARGKIYRTEGIVGLTRAFMFAGASRVVCSLWEVDDAATQALMIKFYELWNPRAKPGDPELFEGSERQGLGAAAALRKAQAHVRSQPKWSHPYYWAAWVLWGLP